MPSENAASPISVGGMLAKTHVDARIAAMIAPITADMGYELIRVRLTGSRMPTLQVMIDKEPNGVTVEDCAELSRVLSALLDVEDPIDKEYKLEVSSPGIDRPLTRLKDFARFAGFDAKLELRDAVDGRKRYRGLVEGVDEAAGAALVKLENGDVISVAFDDLADAKLLLTDELIRASLKGELGAAADGAEIDVEAEGELEIESNADEQNDEPLTSDAAAKKQERASNADKED